MNFTELKQIARHQRILLRCVLFQIIFGFFLVNESEGLLVLTLFIFTCFQSVFVRKLAIKLYGYRVGATLGILTLVPWVGLTILLIVNAKSTESLKQSGIEVGFMGARGF